MSRARLKRKNNGDGGVNILYGVVVCPKCVQAKGVELKYKSSKCLVCGYVMKLHNVKIWAKTDDPDQLPDLVSQAKAQIEGVEYTPPTNRPRQKYKHEVVRPGSKRERIIIRTALELTEKNGSFEIEEFFRSIQKESPMITEPYITKYLEVLQEKGLILEPSPGKFQYINLE